MIRVGLAALLGASALAAVGADVATPASAEEPGAVAAEVLAASAPGPDLGSLVESYLLPRRDPGRAAERPTREAALAAQLERLGADVSVAVLDVEDDAVLAVGDTRVQAASTMKVDIVAALLRARDGRPDRAEGLAARAMITVSDNDATDAMLSQVGRRAVNRLNATAGAHDTRMRDSVWGRTTTTALDRLRLLRAVLGEDAVLDGRSQRFLRSLMTRVVDEQRIGVDAAADEPGGVPLKAGYLTDEDDGRWYVSSMGEVEAEGRTYLVAVVSAGSGSLEAGARRVERAARLAVSEAAGLHEGVSTPR